MFNSFLLDVIIGLVFFFLVYSLLASAINEIFSTLFADRARMLERGIEQMLDGKHFNYYWWDKAANIFLWLNKPAKEDCKRFFRSAKLKSGAKRAKLNKKARLFASQVINHPLYRRKSQESFLYKKPSYIESSTFADIMVDLLSCNKCTTTDLPVLMSDIRSQLFISKMNKNTRRILTLYLEQAHGDVTRFKLLLESWFNESMERVTGWYKRMTSGWVFLIGLTMAVSFNADTLQVVKTLSTKDEVRQLMLQKAAAMNARERDSADKYAVYKDVAAYRDSVAAVNQLLGVGWKGLQFKEEIKKPQKPAGWLLTALAIMMGAPFWFDLLNKLVNLRGTGTLSNQTQSNTAAQQLKKQQAKPDSSF